MDVYGRSLTSRMKRPNATSEPEEVFRLARNVQDRLTSIGMKKVSTLEVI